jgi:hypothetical protein
MINGDDPPPLDAPASQSPESLVRALRALGREQPSDAALRATGQRLQARLNAPPSVAPAPVQTAAVQVASTNTLLAGRLIMAALTAAVGVGSFVLVQRSKPASELPSASTAQLPTSAPHSDVLPVAVPTRLALPTANKASVATSTATTASGSSTSGRDVPAHHASPKSTELRRARERVTKPSASSVAPPPMPIEAVAPSAAKLDVPPAQAAEAAETTREPATAERVAEAPQVAAIPAGELALLLEARKQFHTDPSAVLRLTAEHARRFPDGALAPEREVLAIEALRALGRNGQADERLRRFRASYPDSLHTRAVTTGTTR